jgi:hypothetical protein
MNIQEIESKLVGARTDLSAALERGDDTVEYRSTLIRLEKDLEAAKRAASRKSTLKLQEQMNNRAERREKAAEQAYSEVIAALGGDTIEGVQMPDVELDHDVAEAADRLAVARERLARDEATYQEHHAKWAKIAARLSEKEKARDEVAARRLNGDERETDGAEITALSLDISSLKAMAADAHIVAEQNKPNTARRLVAEAETKLSQVKRNALLRAKLARLKAVEAAMVAAYADFSAECASTGANRYSIYQPSQELRVIAYGRGF